jgi:hypothetical protein
MVEGGRAMLENVWPDLAIDAAKGLLAGSASLAVQWLAPKLRVVIGRLRARRATRRRNLALELAKCSKKRDAELIKPIHLASALHRALRALCRRRR